MLLKVLLILSLVCITITESLIAYYELEDEETRRPASTTHHRQRTSSQVSSSESVPSSTEDEQETPVSPYIFTRVARADARLCGTQLTKTLMKVCGGCVKPPGTNIASRKRSEFWSTPQKRDADVKITEACCKKKCSFDFLKTYCC